MTLNRNTEKWITAGLGIAALVLVLNLVFRSNSKTTPAKPSATPRPTPASTHASTAPGMGEELAKYDPSIHMDKFKEIQDRPALKLKRNPFEFVVREVAAAPAPQVPMAAPAPQTPQAPPPPPLKAVGYTETGGAGEAFVTLQDELFVVHEGESFAKRFRVTKLSPTAVEVFDETTQQTIRLPIGG